MVRIGLSCVTRGPESLYGRLERTGYTSLSDFDYGNCHWKLVTLYLQSPIAKVGELKVLRQRPFTRQVKSLQDLLDSG